ncbi:unnamed protein product [Nezara viridula]|uniref:Uncharacterized protein n=1 Tax=Nezara viridula TaxID=85310 RepID=A0A9P0E8U9_NEZVI|nr:unnamed protein product [Nezara viridula]
MGGSESINLNTLSLKGHPVGTGQVLHPPGEGPAAVGGLALGPHRPPGEGEPREQPAATHRCHQPGPQSITVLEFRSIRHTTDVILDTTMDVYYPVNIDSGLEPLLPRYPSHISGSTPKRGAPA